MKRNGPRYPRRAGPRAWYYVGRKAGVRYLELYVQGHGQIVVVRLTNRRLRSMIADVEALP